LPIIGRRTHAQLDDSLGALKLALSPEQLRKLDKVSAITLGFSHDLLSNTGTLNRLTGGSSTSSMLRRSQLVELATFPVHACPWPPRAKNIAT
jgi:hypothetical protein